MPVDHANADAESLNVSPFSHQTQPLYSPAVETAKDKEIERLNQECLDLEKEVVELKKNAEEALRSLYKQQEVVEAHKKAASNAANVHDENMKDLMEEREALKDKVKAAENAREAAQELVEQAFDRQRTSDNRIALLEKDLSNVQRGSLEGVQTIQERLRKAELEADTLREEHATQTRQSQVRQTKLEESNAELLASLATKERELIAARQAVEDSGSVQSAAAKRELDGLRQRVAEEEAALQSERVKVEKLEHHVAKLETQAKVSAMTHQDERARAQEALSTVEGQLAAVSQRLSEMTPPSGGGAAAAREGGKGSSTAGVDKVAELEEHVKSLAAQLFKKQTSCQELVAERSGMKARLSALQERCTRAEQQLASLKDPEDGGASDYYDGVSGTPSKDGQLKRRGLGGGSGDTGTGSRMITEFEKLGVRSDASFGHAINGIDSWTLLSGRFLKAYPLLRLGFVFYLVMLHVWVFAVLAYHTATMEMEEGGLGGGEAIKDPTDINP